jgi:signal transduction histidine kinase
LDTLLTMASDSAPTLRISLTDISERKQAEAAREAKAREVALAQSKFLATVSHDLRQPVQSLVLCLAQIGAAAAGSEIERPLRVMGHAVNALDTMLTGILGISRLDAGLITAANEAFHIGAMVRRLGAEYGPRAELKTLRFAVRGSAEGARADVALVERILRNLIENALRYTERGGVVLAHLRRFAVDNSILEILFAHK